jgi:hypothetical protein
VLSACNLVHQAPLLPLLTELHLSRTCPSQNARPLPCPTRLARQHPSWDLSTQNPGKRAPLCRQLWAEAVLWHNADASHREGSTSKEG